MTAPRKGQGKSRKYNIKQLAMPGKIQRGFVKFGGEILLNNC